jgi:hypothetical protein
MTPCTPAEMDIAEAITYLCISSCDRNLPAARSLFETISKRHPAVHDLFARLGRQAKTFERVKASAPESANENSS